jgi:ADP-ribose pyrophosphatase
MAEIRVINPDGTFKHRAQRERLVRPDSAAVLVYHKPREEFIFTRQFRYPISDGEPRHILEIPAGGIDESETEKEAAVREVKEEIGYRCEKLDFIAAVYSSPGTSSERIYIYFAEVDDRDVLQEGGGLDEENEDIYLDCLSVEELRNNLSQIRDAKSLIALQWFFTKR